jgi:LysM repeat protein
MKITLFFETMLILIAILASNGFIYSLTYFNLNHKNSPKNISVITNSSEKDIFGPTLLMASNPIRLTSSDSSSSQTLSMTSSESSTSNTLSLTSSDTFVSDTSSVASSDTLVSQAQDIFEDDDLMDLEVNYDIVTHTENSILADTSEESFGPNVDVFENTTSLDSITILNGQTLEQ